MTVKEIYSCLEKLPPDTDAKFSEELKKTALEIEEKDIKNIKRCYQFDITSADVLYYNEYLITSEELIDCYNDVKKEVYEILPLVYIQKYKYSIIQRILRFFDKSAYKYEIVILNNVDNIDYSKAKNSTETIAEGFVNVNTSDIEYSSHLFGRCGVLDHFEKTKLITNTAFFNHEFAPFSDVKMLRMTEHNKKINDKLCKKYCRCSLFLDKIISGTYEFISKKQIRDKDKNIELLYEGGYYHVGEGQHRVCAFKRFGNGKLKADVSDNRIENNKENRNNNKFCFTERKKIFRATRFWERLRNDFYKFYETYYNLNKEQIEQLYKNSTEETFIDNFEKLIGKDILSISL